MIKAGQLGNTKRRTHRVRTQLRPSERPFSSFLFHDSPRDQLNVSALAFPDAATTLRALPAGEAGTYDSPLRTYYFFNRNNHLLELRLTYTKQTTAVRSNRNKFRTSAVRVTHHFSNEFSLSSLPPCDLASLSPASLPPLCARLAANTMPARGKFIVLEGIDGSGKRTQLEMLARAFTSRGLAFTRVSFPRYDGFFGKLIARFLNGEFGPLDAVDPHFSALLYAGDRLDSKPGLESNLSAGRTLLADRYIGSNLAHQTARVPAARRTEFLQWLKQLEYQVYALPPEDLVIYLRVPPAEAQRLVGEKGARDYTKLQRDLQESNLEHLQAASDVYDQLARQPNWVKIECYDSAARALRPPEEIHREILKAVEAQVFVASRANSVIQ